MIAWEYATEYPPQETDMSYGLIPDEKVRTLVVSVRAYGG